MRTVGVEIEGDLPGQIVGVGREVTCRAASRAGPPQQPVANAAFVGSAFGRNAERFTKL